MPPSHLHSGITSHIDEFFTHLDHNGDGFVDIDEWMNFVVHRTLRVKEERLYLAFHHLDKDGDGRITLDELKFGTFSRWRS